jgi:hypothetical protein
MVSIGQRVKIIIGSEEEEGIVIAVGVNDHVPSREDVEKRHMPPECIEIKLDRGGYTLVPAAQQHRVIALPRKTTAREQAKAA